MAKTCLECGKELKTNRRYAYTTTFCGAVCRRVFNNRRATRGAVLYDLTMVSEDARAKGDAKTMYAVRNRTDALLASWTKEDGQRRRWKPARLVFEDTNYLTVERVA